MKKLLNILKLSGVVLLIVMACFGFGIGAAAPIFTKRKDEFIQINTELFESKKESDYNEDLSLYN